MQPFLFRSIETLSRPVEKLCLSLFFVGEGEPTSGKEAKNKTTYQLSTKFDNSISSKINPSKKEFCQKRKTINPKPLWSSFPRMLNSELSKKKRVCWWVRVDPQNSPSRLPAEMTPPCGETAALLLTLTFEIQW